MTDIPIAAPTDGAVNLIQKILDILTQGLGVPAAIAEGYILAPWLKLPIISTVFEWTVTKLASSLELGGFKILANMTIRYQNDSRLADFNDAISKGDMQKARDAADALINRNH
jgi:hypothetical protein